MSCVEAERSVIIYDTSGVNRTGVWNHCHVKKVCNSLKHITVLLDYVIYNDLF